MPVALLGVLFTVAGFVMLVLEVVRALTGSVLGSVGAKNVFYYLGAPRFISATLSVDF